MLQGLQYVSDLEVFCSLPSSPSSWEVGRGLVALDSKYFQTFSFPKFQHTPEILIQRDSQKSRKWHKWDPDFCSGVKWNWMKLVRLSTRSLGALSSKIYQHLPRTGRAYPPRQLLLVSLGSASEGKSTSVEPDLNLIQFDLHVSSFFPRCLNYHHLTSSLVLGYL